MIVIGEKSFARSILQRALSECSKLRKVKLFVLFDLRSIFCIIMIWTKFVAWQATSNLQLRTKMKLKIIS